jgi:sentrin-specific protease 1
MQDDMKAFRLKLAAILLSSDLNKRKGCPYLDSDENIGSPSHYTIIENPKMADQASMKKRKHSKEVECSMVQTDTQHLQTHNISSQVDVLQEDDEFWAFEVMKDMPMSKEEMTELLCDYVMAIQDEAILK